jgi:hypothetical protein
VLNRKLSKHILRIILLFSLALACSSLSTQKKFYEPITASLQDGDYEAALKELEKAREKNKFAEKDRFIYFLDAGLANYYAANFDSSNAKLTMAEAAAEELYTKSITRAAASFILNDNVLEYAGEDYEVLYANLMKAMNYLAMDQIEEAFVEIRRANLKLELLEQKYVDIAQQYQKTADEDSIVRGIKYDVPDVRFNNDAFARYLSMHLYASQGDLDDARIDYDFLKNAFITQPDVYDYPMPEVQYYSEYGPILSIVALAGMSPVKEGLSLRLRTDKDLNLVQILYDGPGMEDVEYGHIPLPVSEDYYFKFAIPVLEARPSQIDRVVVLINGKEAGQLQLLEDVGNVARETYEAKKTLIYIRTLARAIIKGLVAHGMKEKADTGGLEGWLKKAAIDVGTDILENADLRCSRLLPGRVYVADLVLQPGDYDIIFDFIDIDGNVVESKSITGYRVLDRGLNLVQAFSLK